MERSKDDLFTGLTEALARDVPYTTFTSTVMTRAELDHRVHSLNFERDQARSLMLTALANRDVVYAERNTTLIAKDAAIADRDAHRAYAKDFVVQARRVLEHQDNIIRMAMTLLGHVDTLEHEFRLAPQISEIIGYLAFLSRLTLDL